MAHAAKLAVDTEVLKLNNATDVRSEMVQSSFGQLFVKHRLKFTALAVAAVLAGGYALATGDASAAAVAVEIATQSGGAEGAASAVTPAQFNPLLDVQASGVDGLPNPSPGAEAAASSGEAIEVADGSDTAGLSSGELQAIAEAKEALPDHAQYVDARGDFDVRETAKALWETGQYESPSQAVTAANQMELEWLTELNGQASRIA